MYSKGFLSIYSAKFIHDFSLEQTVCVISMYWMVNKLTAKKEGYSNSLSDCSNEAQINNVFRELLFSLQQN